MAEEKAPDPAEQLKDGAKDVVQNFVQTLGLLDLILGGLALYWFRLAYGHSVQTLFPSTGTVFIDVALIACAAAFTGSALSLVVSTLIAAVEIGIEKQRSPKYAGGLNSALAEYLRPGGAETDPPLDRIEYAVQHAVAADPTLRPVLDQIRAATRIAYSVALLGVPYGFTLRALGDPHSLLWIVGLIGAAMALRGIVLQFDYVKTLFTSLVVITERRRLAEAAAAPAAIAPPPAAPAAAPEKPMP